jgi:hypothetical protein
MIGISKTPEKTRHYFSIYYGRQEREYEDDDGLHFSTSAC